MTKTIVSIVSEQTIPNYLFIKEMYTEGDSLLFISSDKFKERIQWIVNTLNYQEYCKVESIIFPQESEERWEDMKVQLTQSLSKDKYYFVNLTGGTKYMSLLTLSVFQDFECEFAYIPYPKNCILIPAKNDALPLSHRLNIKEYMSCYNVPYTQKTQVKSKEYTYQLFKRFVRGELNFGAIDALRDYRNRKKVAIDAAEFGLVSDKCRPVRGLCEFVNDIDFPLETPDTLIKKETEYLTGGWFEEYMYHKIMEYIHPKDIQLGILTNRIQSQYKFQNDLDVVFTSGNKLFIIECKTGILGEGMFNETVNKATAIKEAVLGLSANTFIVSLAGKDERLKAAAQSMGISYKCREDVLNIVPFMEEIKRIAHD